MPQGREHLELLFKLPDLLGVRQHLDGEARGQGLVHSTVNLSKGTLTEKAVSVEGEAGLGELAVLELDREVQGIFKCCAERLA